MLNIVRRICSFRKVTYLLIYNCVVISILLNYWFILIICTYLHQWTRHIVNSFVYCKYSNIGGVLIHCSSALVEMSKGRWTDREKHPAKKKRKSENRKSLSNEAKKYLLDRDIGKWHEQDTIEHSQKLQNTDGVDSETMYSSSATQSKYLCKCPKNSRCPTTYVDRCRIQYRRVKRKTMNQRMAILRMTIYALLSTYG